MAQTLVNFRIDQDLKEQMEQVCEELGLTMTTAFKIFMKKTVREKRIPFEVSEDPFYSKTNQKYLEKIIKNIENGTANLTEHELIEEE